MNLLQTCLTISKFIFNVLGTISLNHWNSHKVGQKGARQGKFESDWPYMHHLTCSITSHFQSASWVNVFWRCQWSERIQKWMLRARSECWRRMRRTNKLREQGAFITWLIAGCGAHQKWSTPPAVVYTSNGLPHEAWFTPKVVHTISILTESCWLITVVPTHWPSTPSKRSCYIEANAKYCRFGR